MRLGLVEEGVVGVRFGLDGGSEKRCEGVDGEVVCVGRGCVVVLC